MNKLEETILDFFVELIITKETEEEEFIDKLSKMNEDENNFEEHQLIYLQNEFSKRGKPELAKILKTHKEYNFV